ncbi:MAG TPA: DUF4350 domain-containing protein [Pyrinomonadaceae bacterium]|jgi:hypothetical protein
MKQKLFIILGLCALIVVLVGLNAVSYTQKEKQLDSEASPNRSTYNLGATGTRAFFELLTETGRKAVRWREAPLALLGDDENKPATFVIVGKTRKEIGDEEAAQILRWVSAGGKLVLIDREPPSNLVATTADWHVYFNTAFRRPAFTTDASDQQEMTTGVKAARPVQPSIYTKGVNGVQPSAFATSVNFNHLSAAEIEGDASRASKPIPNFSSASPRFEPPPKSFATPNANSATGSGSASGGERNAPKRNGNVEIKEVIVKKTPAPLAASDGTDSSPAFAAPVVHINADGRNLLVDVPYGAGKIVFLSDPFIVANGGIGMVDNAQLALNVVESGDRIIAFDEYHQGHGTNENRLLEFFAGTPVIPIFLQIALVVALVLFSQSRRFARAVPEPEPDRLSKLEYVSAMAELQRRTKGYDLAIENIYTDFRRRVARLVGVDAQKARKQDLAMLICERLPNENPLELEKLMQRCEDVMHGDATGKKEVLRLTARLREIEEKLGLQRRKKQRSRN